MHFRPVPDFATLPDGRLRAGPFPVSPAALRRALVSRDLRLSADDRDQVLLSRHAQGIVLSCAGPGVAGYLLDAEAIEASSSDIEDALRDLLAPGVTCRISGHYRFEEDFMIESDAIFWRNGLKVISSEQRRIVHSDGRHEVINARSALRTGGRPLEVIEGGATEACPA